MDVVCGTDARGDSGDVWGSTGEDGGVRDSHFDVSGEERGDDGEMGLGVLELARPSHPRPISAYLCPSYPWAAAIHRRTTPRIEDIPQSQCRLLVMVIVVTVYSKLKLEWEVVLLEHLH